MNPTIFALALSTFAIGVTEFAPMGLLPVIAQGLSVSIPTAGMLITAYALGVMVGAPIMTILLSPLLRKRALVLLMAIFTIGNLLASFAPNYSMLLTARIITSLSHGAFFGLGAVMAISVVPKERQGAAVASMFLGLTIANIGGVPLATWLGEHLGWRQAFADIAVLGVIASVALIISLPRGGVRHMTNLRSEIQVLTKKPVLLALLSTSLGAGAMFTLYTYIAVVLKNITHAGPEFIMAMLSLIGCGFTVGNLISGKLSSRSLRGTLILFFSLLTFTMLIYPLVITSLYGAIIMTFVWGLTSFAIIPPLQTRVLHAAQAAPGLSSSVNIGAFNLGNAYGAVVGGAVMSAGLSAAWIAPAGGVLAVLGLLTIVLVKEAPEPITSAAG